MLAAAVQPEVQTQHLGVAALQRVQRLLDFVRQEPVHRLVFRVGEILGDEALDQRAVAVGIERRIEPHVTRVERGERLRSEEHTSELQSPCNLVCRLLLEKKKKKKIKIL